MDAVNKIVTLLFLIVHGTLGANYTQLLDFYSATITSGAYNSKVFPRDTQADVINVDMIFYLSSIKEFDEVAGTLELIGILKITWTDQLIGDQYNWAIHGNISDILISSSNIWVPTVTVFNSVSKIKVVGDVTNKIRCNQVTGAMEWWPGIVLKTGCNVDASNFPFDKQECKVTFTNWGYRNTEVRFAISSNEVNLDNYRDNEEWSIEKTVLETEDVNSINYATFTLTLARRSLFFLANLVFPILILSLLNAIVFLLPPATGERISYSITAFMSFAVYLTLTSENLPRTSEPLSILCVYLMIMTCISAGTALFTITTLRVFHTEEEEKIPDRLATIVAVLNCKICKDEDDDDDEMEIFAIKTPDPLDSKNAPLDMVDPGADLGDNEKAPLPDDDDEAVDDEENEEKEIVKGKYGVDWKLISATLDFLFFLVFVAGNALITFFFLVPLAATM
ncbi:acetylcholine receptor subunit beta-like [Ylistrum balloti]|uniref:acetylcholine receptor subunit beta-like n=1 Tax=Ylistrum balloti TaxID=509963 RepID=UPI0029059ECC|nr:acetylcholine receptor subunit beta-like [Ylistrum balloti]